MNPKYLLIIALAFLALTSCTSVRQLRYFNDLPDSTVIHLPTQPQEERIIQKGDRLAISFGAANQEAASYFNNYGGIPTFGGLAGGSTGALRGGEVSGYLVDPDGNLEFPKLGKVKVEGLTNWKLADTLTTLVLPYLKDPLVTVKYFSFKFTVLGEVRSPGTFDLPLQRTTLLDALGAAGDLPRTAKRHDIQVYRDYNGQRKIEKIDLRNAAILHNPDMFQVKHNDVIIVQPRDVRLFGDEARTYIGLASLLISAATILIVISRK